MHGQVFPAGKVRKDRERATFVVNLKALNVST